MNKQQVIKILQSLQFNPKNELTEWGEGYNNALEYAMKVVKEFDDKTTPPHYQGTVQPIDLINAQDLNFNLGNVVKYVCRAGKKQGENILTDLEKAKDYINFEIERVKQ